MKYALPAIVAPTSRVLILGTLPGDQSLAAQFYYVHPRNQFWRIVGTILGKESGSTVAERTAFLHRHHLALWDVLHAAERQGSLDTAIQQAVPNDLQTFLTTYPAITTIGLNGGKAQQVFERQVWPTLDHALQARMVVHALPSTSPANTQPFADKLAAWAVLLAAVQPPPA
ncbi:MAG TPA: DNA-deoxyinosine glycosylase [Herpetosiphonaceae bacterium]